MESEKKYTEEDLQQMRQEIMKEFSDNDKRRKEELKIQLQQELDTRTDYARMMQKSPTPWLDLLAIEETANGKIRVEIDWNAAFVDSLKREGIDGPDDETIIQRYLALLMRDISADIVSEDKGE